MPGTPGRHNPHLAGSGLAFVACGGGKRVLASIKIAHGGQHTVQDVVDDDDDEDDVNADDSADRASAKVYANMHKGLCLLSVCSKRTCTWHVRGGI